jgi:hypothetical protein
MPAKIRAIIRLRTLQSAAVLERPCRKKVNPIQRRTKIGGLNSTVISSFSTHERVRGVMVSSLRYHSALQTLLTPIRTSEQLAVSQMSLAAGKLVVQVAGWYQETQRKI